MTSPKRWYQLSVLQLLVALTVVAFFVWANATPGYRQSESVSFFDNDNPQQYQQVDTLYGWPLVYSQHTELGPLPDGVVELIGVDDGTFGPYLFVNGIVMLLILTVSLFSVHLVSSRSH